MIDSNVYAEVYEILSYMDKMTVMKIPIEILNTINSKRNKEYISNIDKNNIFDRNNVLPNTIKYIAWIDVNFWETEEEKERLRKIYNQRIIVKNKELSKKYNPNNIFKDKKVNIEENNSLIEYKESFWKRFLKKIRKWK